MMSFLRSFLPDPAPQLLQLEAQGRLFRFGLLHSSLEQERNIQPRLYAGHSHDVYHVILYIRGEGKFLLGEEAVNFARGTLVLTSPGEVHHFHSRLPGAFAYKEMTFAFEHPLGDLQLPFREMLAGLCGASLPLRPMVQELSPRATRRLEMLLDRTAGAGSRVERLLWYRAHRAAGDVLDFLIEHLAWEEVGVDPGRAGEDRVPTAEQVQRIIEARFNEQLTIEGLARSVHLSPGYLQRLFRAATGTSPIAYQQELRLRAAKALLLTTHCSIGEVARRTGFESLYYFSRLFTREVGMTPSAYRRQEKGNTPGGPSGGSTLRGEAAP